MESGELGEVSKEADAGEALRPKQYDVTTLGSAGVFLPSASEGASYTVTNNSVNTIKAYSPNGGVHTIEPGEELLMVSVAPQRCALCLSESVTDSYDGEYFCEPCWSGKTTTAIKRYPLSVLDELREPIRVRPSAHPRFKECPSSVMQIRNPIEGTSPIGRMGNAVHEYMQHLVCGAQPADVRPIAKAHDVEDQLEDLEFLCRNGVKAWRELAQWFPDAKAEFALTSKLTAGTADVISHTGETAAIADWKTGFLERNYKQQTTAYAYALREQLGMPKSGEIAVVTGWLRLGTYDVSVLREEDLDAWAAGVAESSKRIGKSYNPGPHCSFCPRRLECEARQDYVQASVALMVEVTPRAMTARDVGSLYARAKVLKDALEEYQTTLRMLLKEGPIETDHGTVLRLKTVEKDVIDPQRAWPVLVGLGLSEEDLASCMTIGKGALMTAVGAKAERGNKGKRQAMVLEELRKHDAVTVQVVQQVEESKP